MNRLVSDDAVSEALNHLATSSRDAAAARGMVCRLEFKRKAVRARLTLESNQPTVSAREAAAEASAEYAAACEAEAEAVEADELFRLERNRADTVIRCWQTENANNRAGRDFK